MGGESKSSVHVSLVSHAGVEEPSDMCAVCMRWSSDRDSEARAGAVL